MLNVVIFGPPGAGKGTQSKFLIEKYNLMHISTGDILRVEIAEKTQLGLKAQELISQGKLVPDEVVIGMIQSAILKNKEVAGFIFDGFPRTLFQAKALDRLLEENNLKVDKVLFLSVDKEELIKRLLLRGKESNRPDDQDENIIRNRLDVYFDNTFPLIEFYKEQNKVAEINGVGKIDTIKEDISKEIDEIK